MAEIYLSEHFRLKEFVPPRYHNALHEVPEEVVGNLRRLCAWVLEPARHALNVPFTISSGWRPPAHNAKEGGVKSSDHLNGNAADIQIFTDGKPNNALTRSLFHWFRLNQFGHFGQLILEEHWKGARHTVWVHISNVTAKHPGAQTSDILYSPEKGNYRRYVDGMENQDSLA